MSLLDEATAKIKDKAWKHENLEPKIIKFFCNHLNKEVCKPSWCKNRDICKLNIDLVRVSDVLAVLDGVLEKALREIFAKFPELVADPTTNEQKIIEWKRDSEKRVFGEVKQK